MIKRERYKRLIMFLASVLVIGLQTLDFTGIWYKYYNYRSVIGRMYFRRGYWSLFLLYAVIVLLVSLLFGALKIGSMRTLNAIVAQILSVIASNALFYVQLALIGRWKVMQHITPMLKLTLYNALLVTVWVVAMRRIYMKIYPPRQTILIYDRNSPERLKKDLSSRKDKYIVSETVPLNSGLDYIMERIPHYESVILGDLPAHERNVLLKYCFANNIRCYCSPKISDIMVMSSETINMFDTPLLLFRNAGLTVEQAFFKRLFDILLSVLFLILFSPAFAIIALLIKLYDGGPVFYRQPRLTLNGKVFQIIKFRSMRVDSEKAGARLAMKDDSRITPVGRVIRRIHFDESPQFINILKGDMSIVGPRPERPEIAAEYEKEIPEFAFRLKVKAGLTGYAQVYGKYNTKPYDKLKLDLTYIENYSFILDMQLIAATVKVVFQKDNTEGVEKWQKTASENMDTLHPERAGDKELISVCMPAWNSEKTITQAIDSVLVQKVPLELIVVDDCSTDSTAQKVKAYAAADKRVRYVRNDRNLGAAGSRNRAVSMAKGNYIAFLDSDDYWAEGKLKEQMTVLRESGCVLCCTGREILNADGTHTGLQIGVREKITYRSLLRSNVINCSSVLIRTSAAREFPMEHEDSHEDYITWLKVLKKYGSAAGINEPLLYYRQSAGSKSGSKWKSARMTYWVYRYAGFSPLGSTWHFLIYAICGLFKYSNM